MRRRLALALAVALVLGAGQAAACLVCIELPERTLADRLLAAEAVVLARAAPDRPFSYAPVAALKGAAVGAPIPMMVDGATRRRLAADPEAAVLFARDAEGWSRLADADAVVGQVTRAILAAAADWEAEADHGARFAFFADLHDHPNPTIRELALAEISRSPYAQIRGMTPRTGRAEIVAVVRDPRWMEWAPIHILFLGLGDDPRDHAFVRRSFETASKHGGPFLAAWATALAEIDGPAAIDRLRDLAVERPGRDPESLRAIVTALVTLAQGGDPSLRPAIDALFRDLAGGAPAIAGEVAKQLLWAEDFSRADAFAALMASGGVDDPSAEYLVTFYIDAARDAGGQPRAGKAP